MPEKIYIEGMHGIGDNINQRCFIKSLVAKGHEVWLKTPLPELYAGIPNLHFVRSNTELRTQKKNEDRTNIKFEPMPHGIPRKRVFYGNDHLRAGSVFDAMEEQFGVPPSKMDLPHYDLPFLGIPPGKPVAVVRPTIERTEWHNSSRGPLNEYVDAVARMLALRGWHVISIADTEPGVEWIPDVEPLAHQKFHRGELTIWQMLALVERADLVVTGACVIMHAAIAYQRPMICLQGGNGGNNHHLKVTDPRCSDLSDALFVYPDNYCRCQEMRHNCDKTISNIGTRVSPFIERISHRQKAEAV
ncbi:glycosyltransferase family 9 protein [Escherichia coli]|nr:glycosyltransferase family 9 protein [Escherichia coli]